MSAQNLPLRPDGTPPHLNGAEVMVVLRFLPVDAFARHALQSPDAPQVSPQALVLVEFALNSQDRTYTATFKSPNAEIASKFVDYFDEVLQTS